MAMDQPHARVIRFECNHKMAVVGQHSNVAAGGIVSVEFRWVFRIEVGGAGRNDGKVVSVKMDGVSSLCRVSMAKNVIFRGRNNEEARQRRCLPKACLSFRFRS